MLEQGCLRVEAMQEQRCNIAGGLQKQRKVNVQAM
jgi:hypothetical protein